jgi:hypothetical protein
MSQARAPSLLGLVVGLVVGTPLMAFGVAGVVRDASDTRPADLASWVVGAALVHDLVLAPLVITGVWVLGRASRSRLPAMMWWALGATLVVAFVAWPLVEGFGQDPSTPSLLPRDYSEGLVVLLAAIWGTAALSTIAGHVGARRRLTDDVTRDLSAGS